MRIVNSCAECLYDKQLHLTDDAEYIARIKEIIDNRKDTDTSPYLVYLFNQEYEKRFGKRAPYKDIKVKFNDLVLSMEASIKKRIEASSDPLAASLVYARIGNYIDFGAMNNVDEDTFLSLFDDAMMSENDNKTYKSFLAHCENATSFLLITDNCGEIVLDKLFIEELKKRFPQFDVTVMVRGGEVLNDATMEDALYVGIDNVSKLVSNGSPVAGTVYEMLTDEARDVLDNADIIMAKGQGNYESLCGQGRHIFYAFLCKCDLFTSRFNVPKLTGMFVEELG